jgi:hypothetical protein
MASLLNLISYLKTKSNAQTLRISKLILQGQHYLMAKQDRKHDKRSIL